MRQRFTKASGIPYLETPRDTATETVDGPTPSNQHRLPDLNFTAMDSRNPAVALLRKLWRSGVPAPYRRQIRRAVYDLPHRLRDFIPDLGDHLSLTPLPPPRLRARVGLSSSRSSFTAVGKAALRDIYKSLGESGVARSELRRWLDFGCGSGRIARYLSNDDRIETLVGVDVDREAIEWCRSHLLGKYLAANESPPLPLDDGCFDVVCTVSVLTHMDYDAQTKWLRELHRVLRVGGLLIATTMSPSLTWSRPDLSAAQLDSLAASGFLFGAAPGPFNDSAAFQTKDYLVGKLSGLFRLRTFKELGLAGYLDLSIWEKT